MFWWSQKSKDRLHMSHDFMAKATSLLCRNFLLLGWLSWICLLALCIFSKTHLERVMLFDLSAGSRIFTCFLLLSSPIALLSTSPICFFQNTIVSPKTLDRKSPLPSGCIPLQHSNRLLPGHLEKVPQAVPQVH